MEIAERIDIPEVKNEQSSNKRFTVCGAEFVYLGLIGILTAFAGWLVENTFKAIVDGIIDARFHVLPCIAAYALVPFALQILLGDIDDLSFFGIKLFKNKTKRTKLISNITAYVLMCSVVFIGELGIGSLWDKVFGVLLWDYSDTPLHITKYAGVIPTFGFGTGVWLLFKFVHKPLLNLFRKKANYKAATIIVAILGTLMCADLIRLLLHIIIGHNAPMLWRIYLR